MLSYSAFNKKASDQKDTKVFLIYKIKLAETGGIRTPKIQI